MSKLKAALLFGTLACSIVYAQAPSKTEFATVEAKPTSKVVPLPGELAPFQQTDIEARVPGYVEKVLVDRGGKVRKGQLLVVLSAPEMSAQTAAAESALHQAEAEQGQAEAQAAAAESTYTRLKEAAQTPGAIAGNELIQAEKQWNAAQSMALSRRAASKSAAERLRATREMQGYLRVTAPFDGTITDRFVHPGMLVESGGQTPLLKLQQIDHLRLTIPVPETYVGHVVAGTPLNFRVASQPGKTFSAKIARISRALDVKSRAMMVELDAYNRDGTLAPGMFPTVGWTVNSGEPVLLVPPTSVVTTTERTFVIANQNGHAHWVDVRKGPVVGEQITVRGPLQPGMKVVKRANDEMREGSALR